VRTDWMARCLAALLCLAVCTGPAAALEPAGRAAYLMDPYSGRVFLEKDSQEPLPVASISKLMTLVVVLEAVERGELSPYGSGHRQPLRGQQTGIPHLAGGGGAAALR